MKSYNVKVNGKTFFVEIEEADSNLKPVENLPNQTEQESKSSEKQHGGVSVLSPLPGLILQLVVPNGSMVKKNDKILVIESMKMEHDILAGADGKIAYLVKKGDIVNVDDELAYIK